MSKYEHPYTEHAEYLEFIVSSTSRDEEFFQDLLCAMVEATEKTGKRRILVDRSSSDQTQPIAPMAIYRLSLRMAEAFGASVRVAALSPHADHQTFWEDVSSNRGAIVKASNHRESLLQWLLSDD
ncbi:hypothetical protein AB1K70_14495 [Bremerella sp. JC770]|uniref:hypothetical protein n=1 Tax=Bremerella sp. JC770 TaxID=3232137 RepID=UPI00345ADA1D